MNRPWKKLQNMQVDQLHFGGAMKRSLCGKSFANACEEGKAASKCWRTSLCLKPEVMLFAASKN